jgi:hypothetical protein
MKPFQDSYNAIQNIIFDVQKMTAGPMFFIKKGARINKKHLLPDGSLKRSPFGMIEHEGIDD